MMIVSNSDKMEGNVSRITGITGITEVELEGDVSNFFKPNSFIKVYVSESQELCTESVFLVDSMHKTFQK